MFKNLIAKLRSESGQVTITAADDKKSAASDKSQSQQDEKFAGLIADIDLSDVPEQYRNEVRKKLGEKVKQYDTGFRSKTEDLAREREQVQSQKVALRDLTVLRDEISSNPALEKKITKVINDFRAGNFNPDDSKTKEASKLLDKLIDNASDAETKEQLRQMRQIVKDEIPDTSSMKEELQSMRKELESLKNATLTGQAERVTQKIGQLEERFGKDIIGKYKEQIKESALKFPGVEISKLFYSYADENDVKSALLYEAKHEKEIEQKRKEEGSSTGGNGYRTPVTLKKDRHGRTDIKDLVGQLVSRR